jgi:hypothetical protein
MISLDTRDHSSATDKIQLYPLSRLVFIHWSSGHYSLHRARMRDMLLLLDQRIGFGEWCNRYALN